MAEKIPHMETIKGAAKLTGLSEYFIRQKAVNGEIVSVRAGCKYLINIDKLIEYLNTHTEGAEKHDDPAVIAAGIHPIPAKL